MNSEVTLKDIAAELHVSMTTVHRAIHNKDGISQSMRLTVLEKAKELGYTTNYVASSLKRHTMKVAVVLSSEEGSGRYYHRQFWNAVRSCEAEANSLNVHVLYYAFDETPESQLAVLDKVFTENYGNLDGLLIMPAEYDEPMRRAIERFTYSGVSVVLLDNDIPGCGRICCVAPHNTLTGRLGGELLTSMNLPEGKVLVAGGCETSASHVHNLRGFQAYLSEQGGRLQPLVIHKYYDLSETYREAVEILKSRDDIVAFYPVTARETIPLAQAMIDCGLAGKICGIGSDLYPETAQFLKDGVIRAIISKNAYDKGKRGFRLLFSHLVKKINPPAESVAVPISIIMKNNLPFFADRIE